MPLYLLRSLFHDTAFEYDAPIIYRQHFTHFPYANIPTSVKIQLLGKLDLGFKILLTWRDLWRWPYSELSVLISSSTKYGSTAARTCKRITYFDLELHFRFREKRVCYLFHNNAFFLNPFCLSRICSESFV